MERINAFGTFPDEIEDVSFLKKILYTLRELKQEYGIPFVFEYIQQPMIGGTCRPIMENLPLYYKRGKDIKILGRFNEAYFKKRLYELRNLEYIA